MSEKFSEKLLETRKAQKLSRREVSEKAGISERTLQRYENGERTPTMDTLNLLAKALGKTISDFVSEEDYFNSYHDSGVKSKDISPYEREVFESDDDVFPELKAKIAAALKQLNEQGLEKVLIYANDLAKASVYHYHAIISTREIWGIQDEEQHHEN